MDKNGDHPECSICQEQILSLKVKEEGDYIVRVEGQDHAAVYEQANGKATETNDTETLFKLNGNYTAYHRNCIDRWISRNRGNATDPVTRATIVENLNNKPKLKNDDFESTEAHTFTVTSLVLLPNRTMDHTTQPNYRYVLSGSHDKNIRVWSVKLSDDLHIAPVGNRWQEEAVNCITLIGGNTGSGDDIVDIAIGYGGRDIGDESHGIRLWSLYDPSADDVMDFRKLLVGHAGSVNAIVYVMRPGGRRGLVSASSDGTLKVWDVHGELDRGMHNSETKDVSKDCDKTLRDHVTDNPDDRYDYSVTCLVKLTDRYVMSGAVDKTLKYWDIEAEEGKECIRTYKGHEGKVTCLTVLPGGEKVASGDNKGYIKIWNIPEEQCVLSWKAHDDEIRCLDILTDGNKIVSGAMDNTIKIWDRETGDCVKTLDGNRGGVESVLVLPGGRIMSGKNIFDDEDYERDDDDSDSLILWNTNHFNQPPLPPPPPASAR